MNGMISHRGPDQSGYFQYNNIYLDHSRLAVMDISENGRQPMSVDGRYWIVFNGEIYNYTDIKKELLLTDFKSDSRSHDVIWHLLKHYLMLGEFNNIFDSVKQNYDKKYYKENNLHKNSN